MKTNFIRLQIYGLIALIFFLGACAPAPAAMAPVIPTDTAQPTLVPATATPNPTATPRPFAMTVTVAGGKSMLGGPMQVTAGQIGFKLINKDPVIGSRLIVSTIDADKTLADLNAWPVPDQPPWLQILAFGDAGPGQENVIMAYVKKGPFYLVCFNTSKEMPDIFGPIEVTSE